MFEVGRLLYGSQNLNLDGPDSDKDYKVLLCPEVDDLYYRKRVEQNDTPAGLDHEHYSPMDVRDFDRLVRAGNPNVLEMLYSKECENFYVDLEIYLDYAAELYEKGYLVMVFPQFFKAVKGIVFNSFSRYGVNRKSASRVCFWTTFVEKVVLNNFKVSPRFWSCDAAREMRFNEKIELPTKEDFVKAFDNLEKFALNEAENAYLALDDASLAFYDKEVKDLEKRMKRFVFSMVKDDLRHY